MLNIRKKQQHFVLSVSGFGVFSKKIFEPGEFLLEYRGIIMTKLDAEALELKHAKNGEGCFMFFFSFEGEQMWYVFHI